MLARYQYAFPGTPRRAPEQIFLLPARMAGPVTVGFGSSGHWREHVHPGAAPVPGGARWMSNETVSDRQRPTRQKSLLSCNLRFLVKRRIKCGHVSKPSSNSDLGTDIEDAFKWRRSHTVPSGSGECFRRRYNAIRCSGPLLWAE